MKSGEQAMWTFPPRAEAVEVEILRAGLSPGWWIALYRGVEHFVRESELSPKPSESEEATP